MQLPTVNRSLKVDLFPPDELYPAVRSSIAAYRAALREGYAMLACAHAAGASIEVTDEMVKVTPDNTAAKLICGLATGQATSTRIDIPAGERKRGDGDQFMVKIGRGEAYEVRAQLASLMPNAVSFVLDSARRDIATAWKAPDPEYPRAKRGWLTLQGARDFARFNGRGIGFPVATAKPVLNGRTLTLRWDKEIGPVEFAVGRLEPARFATRHGVFERTGRQVVRNFVSLAAGRCAGG